MAYDSKTALHFIVEDIDNVTEYETKAEALDHAKRRVARSPNDTFNVYQVVAVVTAPVPEAIVAEITA